LWLKQVTDRYEYCSSHDKDLCKGTMSFVVYSTYLMPKQTSQPLYQLFLYSTCVVLLIAGCHKGLFLVNICNSGDKWNCQNNNVLLQCICTCMHTTNCVIDSFPPMWPHSTDSYCSQLSAVHTLHHADLFEN